MSTDPVRAGDVAAVRAALAETLKLPLESVPEDAARGRLEGWDSLNHLAVVAALEERFGLTLTLAELRALDSLAAIVDLLQKRRAR